jgi:hypothetical protein
MNRSTTRRSPTTRSPSARPRRTAPPASRRTSRTSSRRCPSCGGSSSRARPTGRRSAKPPPWRRRRPTGTGRSWSSTAATTRYGPRRGRRRARRRPAASASSCRSRSSPGSASSSTPWVSVCGSGSRTPKRSSSCSRPPCARSRLPLAHVGRHRRRRRAPRSLPRPTGAAAGGDRIPPPSGTLVGYVCERCDEVSVRGPNGLVPLNPARAGLLECDAVIQEADGRRRRKIPPRIRALVHVRDRGLCRVPGCGATGFLHQHHEGEGGWRKTGHDPDKLCLLCLGHHRQRHKGLLTIEPLGGGQFRFLRADGRELGTTKARPAHVGNAGSQARERPSRR